MTSPAIYWTIIGVVLLIVEISTGTFYFLCFAIGAFLAAIIAAIFPYGEITVSSDYFSSSYFLSEIITFLISSFALSFYLPKYFQKTNMKRKVGFDEAVDTETKVVKKNDTLVVVISGTKWRIEDEKNYSEGDEVIIKGVHGTKVILKKKRS